MVASSYVILRGLRGQSYIAYARARKCAPHVHVHFQYESGREITPLSPLTPQTPPCGWSAQGSPHVGESDGVAPRLPTPRAWRDVAPQQTTVHNSSRAAPALRNEFTARERQHHVAFTALVGGTPRRTPFAYVANENHIANHTANLAGTQRVATRWPTHHTRIDRLPPRSPNSLHRIASRCTLRVVARHVARRSRTLARSNVWRSTCHIGSDATRGDTVADVLSAIVAYTCSYVYL